MQNDAVLIPTAIKKKLEELKLLGLQYASAL